MVSVAVGDAADECGDDDLWALAADGQDGVIKDALMTPAGEGFFLSFGEAEVDFRSPELFGAVVFAGFKEFIGADEAQGIVGLGGHRILAAFAAGEGEQCAACAESAGEIGEERAVFVVGMGDDHQDARSGLEAAERLSQCRFAAVFSKWQGNRAGLGQRNARQFVAACSGTGCSGGGWLGRLLGVQAEVENACDDEAGKGRARCCPKMFAGEEHTSGQCTIRGALGPLEITRDRR